MKPVILDGSLEAYRINQRTKRRIRHRIHNSSLPLALSQPLLVVIAVDPDASNRLYIKMKARMGRKLGVRVVTAIFNNSSFTQKRLLTKIHRLNADSRVNGIIVQMPLPDNIDSLAVNNAIDPNKDVDGVTAENRGRLASGHPHLVGCTPLGIMKLLRLYFQKIHNPNYLSGKKVTILGRSEIVGKPLADIMINDNAETTVLNHYANSNIINGELITADIIVSATGIPNIVSGMNTRGGQIMVDVGEHLDPNHHLEGDIAHGAKRASSAYTPVPGGIGPMTISMIFDQLSRKCTKY